MVQIVRMEPKDRLKRARAAAGFETPSDAARALRINKNTLISHENGNRPISRKAAENYARLFGVSAGWLLFAEGEPETGATPIDRLRAIISRAAQLPEELQERIVDFAEFEINRYERERENDT